MTSVFSLLRPSKIENMEQRFSQPIQTDLVLVGGGHSHAIALRMFGMNPLPGVRITLISDASDTPYSGMVPGHVAGFYSHEECHINLRSLCQFAQVQFIVDHVIGLDLENHRVLCANHPAVVFDWVSIDIGSTPKIPDVVGAKEHSIGAKPIQQFLKWWNQRYENFSSNLTLAIIGGGTGGVELALNMQHRLRQKNEDFTIHLFQREQELMPTHNAWVRHYFQKLLTQRNIQIHLGETVEAIQENKIVCESGLTVNCDEMIWVTQASAPAWVKESGLSVDEDGFILVNDALRSISHAEVFAAGDIATMSNYSRPKAGVFAVRQGKPLFQNLRSALTNQPLKPYHPQKYYLSLIGTGDGSAVASYGAIGWHSRWLWHWKDRIDRAFMNRFSQLPTMESTTPQSQQPEMHCLGCGAKVGSRVLERSLQRVFQEFGYPDSETILIGLDSPDDAAVIQVPTGQVLVQTIDYFPALISDPFLFGQISTNHSLSDLFAMGATPQSALAMATLPYATESKQEETLYQLLSGTLKTLRQSGSLLIGGHTIEGESLAFGLTCNGFANPERLLRKHGMQPGNVLILTKAIGTGTLFAADMRHQARARWIDDAIASMLLSNQQAAACFLDHDATACTDITGFGLLGHLLEMVRASQVSVKLELNPIPILEGARDCVRQNILSSLYPQNFRTSQWLDNLSQVNSHPDLPLLFDPQTSGGLLASVPFDRASACLEALKAAGYSQSTIVGSVFPLVKSHLPLTIVI
jgi:selenide,water dikinase